MLFFKSQQAKVSAFFFLPCAQTPLFALCSGKRRLVEPIEGPYIYGNLLRLCSGSVKGLLVEPIEGPYTYVNKRS
jgi:hypothetical protein